MDKVKYDNGMKYNLGSNGYWYRDYQQNKHIHNANNNCECGGKYTNQNKKKHIKTKKHLKYLESKK
jgi:hypothetical protein